MREEKKTACRRWRVFEQQLVNLAACVCVSIYIHVVLFLHSGNTVMNFLLWSVASNLKSSCLSLSERPDLSAVFLQFVELLTDQRSRSDPSREIGFGCGFFWFLS